MLKIAGYCGMLQVHMYDWLLKQNLISSDKKVICAGKHGSRKGIDICQGDSGSPMAVRVDGMYI